MGEPEYACGYANGRYAGSEEAEAKAREEYKNEDGYYAVIMVAVILGYTYPITPRCDKGGPDGHCKFYGSVLDARYSSRMAAVSEEGDFLCEDPDPSKLTQYHEV